MEIDIGRPIALAPDIAVPNPRMGMYIWRQQPDFLPGQSTAQVSYERFLVRSLIALDEKGVWTPTLDSFERWAANVTARHEYFAFRLQLLVDGGVVTPATPNGIPSSIINNAVVPDWNSAELQACMRVLFKAIYDLCVRRGWLGWIAWIDGCFYGRWGEGHMWSYPASATAKEATLRQYVELVRDQFPSTLILMPLDNAVMHDYALTYAPDARWGLRADSFGQPKFTIPPAYYGLPAYVETWPRMEDPNRIDAQLGIRQIQLGVTGLGNANMRSATLAGLAQPQRDAWERFPALLGYRLRVVAATINVDTWVPSITFVNEGVACVVEPMDISLYYVAEGQPMSMVRATGQLEGMLPHEVVTVELPAVAHVVRSGQWTWALRVTNEQQFSIHLAQEGMDTANDGVYALADGWSLPTDVRLAWTERQLAEIRTIAAATQDQLTAIIASVHDLTRRVESRIMEGNSFAESLQGLIERYRNGTRSEDL